MMDPNGVMTQVQTGNIPPTWRVLRARSGYFISGALLYGAFGLAMLGVIAYLIVGDHIFYYGAAPTDAAGAQGWLVVDVIVSVALAAVFFATSIVRVVGFGSAQQQMLVLTPEGFVAVTAKGAQSFPFAGINGMTAAAVRGGGVVVTMRRADNGQQVKYTLDGRFGAPKTVAGSILAAQGQYATAMAQPRPPLQG